MNLFLGLRAKFAARRATVPAAAVPPDYLRRVLLGALVPWWLMVPLVAWAAPAATDAPVHWYDSPPLLIGMLAFLSTLSGVTALFLRLDKQYSAAADPTKPLPRAWMFCCAHMGGSWLMGAVAFAMSQQVAEPNIWTVIVMVISGSFLGSKGLELVAEKTYGKLAGDAA